MSTTKKSVRGVSRMRVLKRPFMRLHTRVSGLLKRRPHRSFRRTRRRDYVRSLKLPGYWAFTASVLRTIWQGRRLLLLAALCYGIAIVVVAGWTSQEAYTELGQIIADPEAGAERLNRLMEAGLLLVTSVASGINGADTLQAQVFSGLIMLLFWLVLVWILRSQLAGRRVKLRDALYNSGAPLLSTILVLLLLVLQMIPLTLSIIIYGALQGAGVLAGGVEAMLAWFAIALLAVLSIYWLVSSILALVIVTLPGMYPMQAIRTAGDMVVGRRMRIFLRLLWMVFIVAVVWALVMIPFIILDGLVKEAWQAVSWLPAVPVMLVVMSTLTIVFVCSYIYLMYRKIVDDDAKPA